MTRYARRRKAMTPATINALTAAHLRLGLASARAELRRALDTARDDVQIETSLRLHAALDYGLTEKAMMRRARRQLKAAAKGRITREQAAHRAAAILAGWCSRPDVAARYAAAEQVEVARRQAIHNAETGVAVAVIDVLIGLSKAATERLTSAHHLPWLSPRSTPPSVDQTGPLYVPPVPVLALAAA